MSEPYFMIDLTLSYLSKLRVSLVVFVLIVSFNVIDIYSDLLEGSSLTHIIEESIMVLVFISIIIVLAKKVIQTSKQFELLKSELSNLKQINAKQSEEMQKARENYSDVIKNQFEKWALTPSETETGFLLLKGLSLKEIANVRDVKEKTARQQSSNIYAKAGVVGRHEFAGWFFEER